MFTRVPIIEPTVSHFEMIKKSKFLPAPNALLKFLACSIESVPTKASPTIIILFGLAALANDDNGAINLASLCLLPAVSISIISNSFFLAYSIAFLAIFATKSAPPYPPSNNSILSLFSSAEFFKLFTCTLNCSTAPDLKVSQATIKTLKLFCNNQKANFDKFVDLPTPLTPTTEITYGFLLDLISSNKLTDVPGVKIFVKAFARASLAVA
ncbi:hypothetical protein WICMUC_000688 [Wickerhamomyces mucosus]|uniref:Uncharacterized protein n=1 Tax=Wickerhamomyces mucosus TaxID=1378264 RepID=A0A9P8PYI5_9ASCO|nr:hypothetical protein WICMUC_000688 [Wickerhamomyces mucosus]